MQTSQVNKKLIWDFDWKESEYNTKEFERWYIQRVLSEGMYDDIMRVGIQKIAQYFHDLYLPPKIRNYWDWFFKEVWKNKAS